MEDSQQTSSTTHEINIGMYDGGFELPTKSPCRGIEWSRQRQVLNANLQDTGPSNHWSLTNFDIGRPLGKGHFGRVYLARVKSRSNPFVLVLKCLLKDDIIEKGVQVQVKREIEIMQQLRHPNVIRFYGWFHDVDRLFLMLEFAGHGELFKHLCTNGRLSERSSSKYISQVASGLRYLHTQDIIHRDIKPENLFIGLNGEIKIGDFGWSVQSPLENRQRTLAGTLSYVAPEMILGQPYGKSVDIWALGVLTYELTCGEEPFGADTSLGPRLVHSRICRCDVHYPVWLSIEAQNFIFKLLQLKPSERLDLLDVPLHGWITQNS
ncbi:hypothetical protein L204_104965 [Cryptococcus depauperatus]|nr:AUR protein kinase [Cryptococcus depauperatus CBS 7855]